MNQKTNKIIVGNREIGKTTYLLNCILDDLKNNKKVAVLDSVTDHKSKSLMHKLVSCSADCYIYCPTNEDDIVDFNSENYYEECMNSEMYKNMQNNADKTICVDLGYFLELGHYCERYGRSDYAKFYRSCYNKFSLQAACCLMLLTNNGDIKDLNVYCDEIEFPLNGVNIDTYQDLSKIRFVAAVHEENAFGDFYKTFSKNGDFSPYLGDKSYE